MEKILLPKLESRLTKLSLDHLNPDDQRQIYILRDDELGGFWGTKFRKYASINAHCLAQNIPNIIATGGINSNNLAAAATLCAEKGLKVSAFAVDDHSENPNLQTGTLVLRKPLLNFAPRHLVFSWS
jgi:1-aminocyclopropane-1-carboxylate deaminase/D-cysteine desulfhydrase-like pyridoxal-dependent ACC family enzyme